LDQCRCGGFRDAPGKVVFVQIETLRDGRNVVFVGLDEELVDLQLVRSPPFLVGVLTEDHSIRHGVTGLQADDLSHLLLHRGGEVLVLRVLSGEHQRSAVGTEQRGHPRELAAKTGFVDLLCFVHDQHDVRLFAGRLPLLPPPFGHRVAPGGKTGDQRFENLFRVVGAPADVRKLPVPPSEFRRSRLHVEPDDRDPRDVRQGPDENLNERGLPRVVTPRDEYVLEDVQKYRGTSLEQPDWYQVRGTIWYRRLDWYRVRVGEHEPYPYTASMVPVRFGTSRVPAYREPGTVEAPFQYIHLLAYLFGTVTVRGTQVQS